MTRIVLLGAAISTLLTACDNGGRSPGWTTDLKDLCNVLHSSVQRGEQERAFFDGAHDALHTLADRVTEKHPGVAADLLEAKERVESNLREVKRAVPTRAFEDLIAAADRALVEIDVPEIDCQLD